MNLPTHNATGNAADNDDDELRVLSWNIDRVRHEAPYDRVGV